MRDLALDLWQDLRDRRLWPVAGALLVALIAIPAFVMKPAEEAAPAEVKPAAGQGSSTPAVAVLDEASRGSSRLGVFGRKDPFRPPAAALRPATSSATATSSAAGASAPKPTGTGSPSTGGGAGGSAPGKGPSGAPSPTAPKPEPAPRRVSPKRAKYTYVVDVTFRASTRTRRVKGLTRLEMLPSERSPLFIFLGVDVSGTKAAFVVDSTLTSTSDEGTCRPVGDCGILYLDAGEQHSFAGEDATPYVLRVDQIRRVRVAKATSSAKRRRARASRPSRASRRFVPPVLADLLVSSEQNSRSRPGRASR